MARANRHYIPGYIWTESVAVGSRSYIEIIQKRLSFRARGRRPKPLTDGVELREPLVPYNSLFRPKNEDIG